MDIGFNPETQKLVLKPEYVGGDPIYLKKGNVIKLVFNPIEDLETEYIFFYENGLNMIFDVVDI